MPPSLKATRPGQKKPTSSKKKEGAGFDLDHQGSFFRHAFFFCLKWGIVTGLWGIIAVLCIAAWYARELPTITRSATFERKPAITVLANDGSVIARYGDIKGENLTVKDFPPDLVHAVLATEDRRFYYHFGVDPIGLFRAVVVNIARKGVVQGGSTITQQLAKNLFLTQERTLKRKIQEALLALWLEHELTKDEILAAYLNRVYLGAGAYGMDAASQVYFKKSARALTLRESAILAGLLKAPSKYSPRSNPQLAEERARVVINNMKAAGYLNEDEIRKISTLPTPRRKPLATESAQYYADWVTEQLDDLVGAQEDDLIIETTMDPDVQKAAAENIERVLQEQGEAKHMSQGSAIVMRRDGAVLALVGGRDYGSSEFNRATHALRSPGSSFKPIVYLTALEQGYTPETMVTDAPIEVGSYRPTNFDGKYYGDIPLRGALAFSLNTVAIQLMQQTGVGSVINSARRLGITARLEPNLSTALGSNGTTQLEMTTAYTVFANGGLAITPYGITKISSKDGTVLYQRRHAEFIMPRVFSRQAVSDLTTMMQGVTEFGTGMGAKLSVPTYGKTGTSQDYRDAWFDGFAGGYVASVWVGNDDNSSMKRVTGGSAPANIWRGMMTAALADPTPAPDIIPASDDAGFTSLMDRVLSIPASSPSDNSNNGNGSSGFTWFGEDPQQAPQPIVPSTLPAEGQIVPLPGSGRYND